MPKPKILVLHGPNLNYLGIRETEHYGKISLDSVNRSLVLMAEKAGACLQCLQTNSESLLIESVHKAFEQQVTHIIINPAAYTHTSIALRDALILTKIPFIEVHLSNIYAREDFRQRSYFSDVAQGTITGLGANGYLLALSHILFPLTS